MGNYTPNPFMTQPTHLPPLTMADGRVVVVGAMIGFFSRIYYFIVVVILFYCDVYIILLC